MSVFSVFLCLFVGFLSFVIYYVHKKFKYWQECDVPFIVPKFPLGNIQGASKKIHSSQMFMKFYQEMKDSKNEASFGGIYLFTKPAAIALDLDFIKNILVKDFQYFHDRGMYYNEKVEPLGAHLFSLEGDKWKNLRAKLTPAFTSGKMKIMNDTIVEIAEEFKQCLAEETEKNSEIEIKEILARFTTDVIGRCAFGIECNSLKDPNALFRQMGRKVFDVPKSRALQRVFMASFRNCAKFLKMKVFDKEVNDFFLKIVNETVDMRETNKITRNDFMDILIKLKSDENFTNANIAAQSLLFFLGGFETSSTTMSFCLYELALNVNLQEEARAEVLDILNANEGHLSYEAIAELKFLDKIINETLRKYPPISSLFRIVTKDYGKLKKGDPLIVPVYAIHHDPELYSEPDLFNPDRFNPEEVANRHPCAFLAFGSGPRNCIGLRFGMMQTKIGLATLLANFNFTSCEGTQIPIVFSRKSAVLSAEHGIWLNVEKIKK